MGTGKNVTRADIFDKVTDSARYTVNLEPQGLLVVKVIHSIIANGVVKSFDLEEARKVPGVMKIVTCPGIPDIQFPTPNRSWSVETAHQDIANRELLNTRVWVYGDDITVVAAGDDIVAVRAARLAKVEYGECAPLLTVEDAMAEGASRLHDEKSGSVTAHPSLAVGEGTYGETAKGEGLVGMEKDYRTQSVQHCHIETLISFAYMEEGRATVTTSTQIPHIVRRIISQVLGLPMGHICVIKPYTGGGFDNKQDVLYGPLNAFLTTQVGGREVRVEISREEALECTRVRYAIEFKAKAAARKDDTSVARKLEAYSDQGGYVSHAHTTAADSPSEFKQIYKDEKVLESGAWTAYTDLATDGAVRGYGIPQAAFAAECMADDLALTLHIDPLESRKKSYTGPGYVDPRTHVKCNTYGLTECMEKGREFIRWDEKRREYESQTGPVRKGIGMAIFCYRTGVYLISLETVSCRMILNQDDSIRLQMGVTKISQGADTVFTQMAAEVIEIMEDKVDMLSTQDTDVNPSDTGAYASRQTYVSGVAVKKIDAISEEKILDYAVYMLEKPQNTLDVKDNHIVNKETGMQLLPMEELAITVFCSLDRPIHITAEATSHCKTNTFTMGVCLAEVEMDMPLGKMKVTNIVSVHDSGKLINPKLVAAQVHGGMSMGLDYGLNEELLLDAKGRPLNDSLLDYKLPIAVDTSDLSALFVELDDPAGPFGGKVSGEPLAIPVAPVVRNTVFNATGVAVDSLLMDPQKMVKHFKEVGLIQEER